MGPKAGAAASFFASAALGYAALYSGIWYLLVAVGFAVGLLVRCRWTIQVPALFAGGVASTLLFVVPLFGGNLLGLMEKVGEAAGIGGGTLFALLFLISGTMVVSGGLVGSSLSELASKKAAKQAS